MEPGQVGRFAPNSMTAQGGMYGEKDIYGAAPLRENTRMRFPSRRQMNQNPCDISHRWLVPGGASQRNGQLSTMPRTCLGPPAKAIFATAFAKSRTRPTLTPLPWG